MSRDHAWVFIKKSRVILTVCTFRENVFVNDLRGTFVIVNTIIGPLKDFFHMLKTIFSRWTNHKHTLAN